jgi:hypothetical protein
LAAAGQAVELRPTNLGMDMPKMLMISDISGIELSHLTRGSGKNQWVVLVK